MDNNTENNNVVVPDNTNVTPVEPEVFTEELLTEEAPVPSEQNNLVPEAQPVEAAVEPAPAPEAAPAEVAPSAADPVQPALPVPASAPAMPETPVTQEQLAQPTNPTKGKKKVNNKVIILALIVLIVFGVGYYYMGNKKNPVVKKNNTATNATTEKEYKKIETGHDWGDEYSVEAQRFLDTFDAIDVAFIDLDFNDSPEMIVKYVEDKKTSLQIFSLSSSNAVSASKAFVSANLELIYSLIDGKSRFYVHIKNSDKYGTYTETEKIINSKVKKPDIEATNDNQVSDFKEHYVVSDYNITFYEVKKGSFEENFKTMIDRFGRYAKEIEEERDKLDENNKDRVVKKEDSNDSLTTAEYKLVYGKYTPDELYITDGSINPNIILNNDNTVTIGDETFRFEVNANTLSLEDGKTIVAIGNDSIRLDENGGIIYRAENPINMTDKEKKDIDKKIRDAQRKEKEEEKEKEKEQNQT